jgi:hypothetical protein
MRSEADIKALLTKLEHALTDSTRKSTKTGDLILYSRIQQLSWVLGYSDPSDPILSDEP